MIFEGLAGDLSRAIFCTVQTVINSHADFLLSNAGFYSIQDKFDDTPLMFFAQLSEFVIISLYRRPTQPNALPIRSADSTSYLIYMYRLRCRNITSALSSFPSFISYLVLVIGSTAGMF